MTANAMAEEEEEERNNVIRCDSLRECNGSR